MLSSSRWPRACLPAPATSPACPPPTHTHTHPPPPPDVRTCCPSPPAPYRAAVAALAESEYISVRVVLAESMATLAQLLGSQAVAEDLLPVIQARRGVAPLQRQPGEFWPLELDCRSCQPARTCRPTRSLQSPACPPACPPASCLPVCVQRLSADEHQAVADALAMHISDLLAALPPAARLGQLGFLARVHPEDGSSCGQWRMRLLVAEQLASVAALLEQQASLVAVRASAGVGRVDYRNRSTLLCWGSLTHVGWGACCQAPARRGGEWGETGTPPALGCR